MMRTAFLLGLFLWIVPLHPTHAQAVFSTPSRGPQGVPGNDGAAGVPGTAGATGATGATGPAGPDIIGYPTTRTFALATAYQCTNNAKPCLVTVNLTSSATFSLVGGVTNTASIFLGSTAAVATGTGTAIGRYSNSSTAGLAVGVGVSTIQANPAPVFVPIGGFFAILQTGGAVTITSAFDQAVG